MKREIKFRAWDTFDNRMRDWANLKRMAYAASGGVEYVFNSEHFRVMQYTGLKDRNGVEIYELDIIKLDDIVCPITWNNGGFQMISSPNQGNSPINEKRLKEFIVIGNIYENPDLLV